LVATVHRRQPARRQRHRNALLPDVPIAAEQGLRELVAVNWFGFVVPARTPRPIVEKLHSALLKIAAQPDTRERFAAMGLEPMTMASPEAFGAFFKSEIARWSKVAQIAGIKAQ
jgi:tripartite-type tricarboxylate transporter receptor subunit TctC